METPSDQPAETHLFNDLDTSKYDKSLKQARILLYIVAGLQLLVGIIEFSSAKGVEINQIAGVIDGGIGIMFILFALWSYKKPATAFMTALILFIVIHVVSAIFDPTQIAKGIILKIIVIIGLIKAFNDARSIATLKDSTGSNY